MKVPFSQQDLAFITEAAHWRHNNNRRRGSTHKFGFNGGKGAQQQIDVQGVADEYAVARHLGLPWEPHARDESREDRDVGEDIQVRATTAWRNLLLHDEDRDWQRFVLVWLDDESADLKGWIYGRQAKTPGLWKELVPGRPCYVYSWKDLRSMSTLTPLPSDTPVYEVPQLMDHHDECIHINANHDSHGCLVPDCDCQWHWSFE